MEKILSICVPSYNMEAYLARNVESMLKAGVNDELEIIIVNDGSKDGTLVVANKYKALYPDTVTVIDKPNGHYGSCVNAALKVARGKYFRTVDADDWVDGNNFKKLIENLRDLNVDCVFTRFSIFHESDGKIEEKKSDESIEYNQILDLNKYHLKPSLLHMHCLTYSSQFLYDIAYKQTEGICYTDSEYVFIPLYNAKTLICYNFSVYVYYVGRDDQSMSPSVLRKNFMHFYKILARIADYDSPHKNINANFLKDQYYSILMGYLLPIHIIYGEENNEQEDLLRSIMTKISNQGFDAQKYLNSSYGLPYQKMWYSNGKIDKLFLRLLRMIVKVYNNIIGNS